MAISTIPTAKKVGNAPTLKQSVKPILLAMLAVSTLTMVACAGKQQSMGGYESNEALRLAAANDGGYAKLSYKYLPAGKSVRLAINRDDQSMVFEGGKSFVEALVLPAVKTPYLIEVQSEMVVAGDERHGSIFFPVLTFLDANKKPIRTFNELPGRFRTHLSKKPQYRTAITIDQSLANARYLLVHTDASQLNYAISTKNPETRLQASGFESMLYAPTSKARYRVNFSAEGWVDLIIKRKAS